MKNARKSPWRLLYKFHRYAGLLTTLIIIMLAITGIALNHTDALRLDKRYVASPVILDWYGLGNPEQAITFKTGRHWVTQIGDQVFLDQKLLLKQSTLLVGAVATESYVVIAFTNSIIMATMKAEVIEVINKNVQQLGSNDAGHIFIRAGDSMLVSDDDLLSWQKTGLTMPVWSQRSAEENPHQKKIFQLSRSRIIPYERLMLDIHSGRFFGRFGVLMVDAAGVILLLLAFSGCWMWLRHKLIQVRRKSHNKITDNKS